MEEVIMILNIKDRAALATVRCIAGLEAAVCEDKIFLKGFYILASADSKLKQLPILETYFLREKTKLFKPDGFTAIAELPNVFWEPLTTFIKIELPTAAMPGHTNEKIQIKLVQLNLDKQAYALFTNLTTWKLYGENESAIRLEQLHFAVSENNKVLIIGLPIPSLPGKTFWLYDDLLLPTGYHLEMPMVSSFINEQYNKNKDAILLFAINGSWQRIDKTFFVHAKRSAIRLTKVNN
jgi:MoxR-vWA-beta-propeller ternary system domain bpX2